ncbi:MAG: helix-turn-helix domain-containing protein [Anaerolineae bacterium]|nr:helix-turn-helix domain-containing protein [Anaerolineae bacterium]
MDEILENYAGIDEISRALSIHAESARRLIRQGKLRGQRVGNKWLVHRSVLAEFAETYNSHPGRRSSKNKLGAMQQAELTGKVET